jgi:hypothetical protein
LYPGESIGRGYSPSDHVDSRESKEKIQRIFSWISHLEMAKLCEMETLSTQGTRLLRSLGKPEDSSDKGLKSSPIPWPHRPGQVFYRAYLDLSQCRQKPNDHG